MAYETGVVNCANTAVVSHMFDVTFQQAPPTDQTIQLLLEKIARLEMRTADLEKAKHDLEKRTDDLEKSNVNLEQAKYNLEKSNDDLEL